MPTITSISNLERDIIGFWHKNPKKCNQKLLQLFLKSSKKKQALGLLQGTPLG